MVINQEIGRLIAALERRDDVSAQERAAIIALPRTIKTFAGGAEMVKDGVRATQSCLLLEGFAVRVQSLASGKRQLTAVHVAGDFVDLHAFTLKRMDHSVAALGPCKAAFVPHTELEKLTTDHPHLGRLLWMSTTIDGSIQRAWITCMGRRTSRQHLAHLLCEIYVRLEIVGLAENGSFEFPIIQEELGDMVGLSTVHVNRTLKDLRAMDLIEWRANKVTILDFAKLAKSAEFDAAYLHLERDRR